jgi:hypothetical protein
MALNTTELKAIADGLHALGRPGHDTLKMASARLDLMERFTVLLERATPAERHALAATLRSMLEPAR